MDEHNYICLPEHTRPFIQTKLVPEIYTQDENNEMFYGICGAQEKNEDDFQLKLNGFYYPLNDCISWLTTCMEEMRKDIAIKQTQRAAKATTPASIDRNISTSIDDDPSQSNPTKSKPNSYTRAEEDSGDSEIHHASSRGIKISTDSHRRTSIDEAIPTEQGQLVTKVTSNMSDTINHDEEISDDTYTTLVRHQFELECLGDRLQKIENTTATMKDKWHRGYEAIKDFTDSTKDIKVDQPVNYLTLAENV
ncbi:hypothetical protein F2Q69_00015749 [Brassica cretica]|uniref:Uncharacterized protein n=1 Tax=Brassica cretica TaxID=69181 RepID=A0A8S9QT97_BRACR|nr:hypothetical protein F2Q69_00015749 [Brassica cretica]